MTTNHGPAADDGPTPDHSGEAVPADVAAHISYPEPPPHLRRFSLKGALVVFGPGAIIASVTIGSGETVFSARGGAIFGYAIIWTFVVGAILKGAMMYASNRYITVAGEHPMTRWAHSIPGPKRWFPVVMGIISIGSFPFWAGGLSRIIGDYASSLTVGQGEVWATGFLVFCGALAWLGGYALVERAQILIVGLMLVAVIVAVFWANPDWLGVLYGFVPHGVGYDGWIADKYPALAARPLWVETVTYIGAIGGGIYDYIGYTGLLRHKRWGLLGHDDIIRLGEQFEKLPEGQYLPLPDDEREVAKAKSWSRAPYFDVLLSITAVTVFAVVFVINGANLLHEQQLVPAEENLLTHQAQFLAVITPALEYLYFVGIFFAFFGTLLGLWEVYTSTAHETVGAVFPKVRRTGVQGTRRWLYPYVFLAALVLIWTGAEPVVIVTPAAIIGGVFGVGLFAFALLHAERRVLPPAYRLKGIGWWLTLAAGFLLTGFGIIAILQGVGLLPG